MKISCCLIVRDEALNLEKCLQSVRPHVDELCILDTGSTDRTPEIAQQFADKFEVWTGCNDADGKIADFSAARNRNLAMATGDALLWLDGDDVLVNGQELRGLFQPTPAQPTQWLAPYEYDHDDQGRVTTLQWRERLVYPLKGYEWRGPVHEGLLGKAGTVPQSITTDAFKVVHRRKATGKQSDPGRNLRILRAWFKANGNADTRLMHYYGAELLINRHIGEAMYWLRRHKNTSDWSDERCISLMHLARIHLAMGDGEGAAGYAVEAMTTKRWPAPLWLLGQAYCMLSEQGIDAEHNLLRGSSFLEQGMALPNTPTLLMQDPTMRHEACHWLSIARARLGDLDGAVKWATEGTEAAPDHTEMAANLKGWKAWKAKEQVRSSMVELHKLGAVQREAGVLVESALNGQFKVERSHGNSNQANHEQYQKAFAWNALSGANQGGAQQGKAPAQGALRIGFWLGHQLEPWTPETLERDGMGGSETMAWEMSKRLAKLGHQVVVFGHCDKSGVYEDVVWCDAELLAATPNKWDLDVLIVSRQSEAVTLPHSAKVRVLWVHDVHCGDGLTPAIAAKYDLIWCLSEWHKKFFLQVYPWMPPAKVEVTRNAIDVDRFRRTDIKRDPLRAVYSSSPDRGLVTAVRAWPEVRKRVPGAELHCFYGFDNWERSLQLGGENGIPWCSRAALDELKQLVATTKGVFMHGRINGKQLAEEMLRSSVWAYNTWFSETSCITAMEAQAAGLACVCPSIAALAETVEHRFWTGDFVGDMERAFKAAPFAKAERHDFPSLVDEWNTRLRRLVDSVVPAFSEAAQ